MVTVLALDHLVLVSGDVEATLAWYGRHAGLEGVRVEEWRAGQAPFPSLRVSETLIVDVIPGPNTGKGHLDHLCFVVSGDDLAELLADPALAVEQEGERFGAQGVARSIYVRDPDGLLVEFRAYPA
jgi:catechol 2,3-dioxygenase-like lactoylglutathione lyase family enzyme